MIDFVANKGLIKYSKEFGFSNIYSVDELNFIEGKDDNTNRRALESKNTDVLFGIEKFRNNDRHHFRDSGLNQVLCKLANKNKIKIGCSFRDVLNSDGEERARILGRMLQNIRLCNKYKVGIVIASFAKSKHELKGNKDLVAFGRLIGANKIWNENIDNFYKEEDFTVKQIK